MVFSMRQRITIFTTIALVAFSALLLASKTQSAEAPSPSKSLPGLQTGEPPWIAETANLLARLKAINLPALQEEGNKLHIHQHLDIIVHEKSVTVPADIGINYDARFIAPLHTHDRTD